MTKSHLRTMLALAVVVALALATGACGSSDKKTTASSPTATSADAVPAADTTTETTPPATSTVGVEASEMKFALTSPTATAGKVTFNVKNVGTVKHEMVVIKTDKGAGDLAVNGKVPETGAVGEVESDDLGPGVSVSKTMKLKAGHYALISNLPGHYSGGMYADLNVS